MCRLQKKHQKPTSGTYADSLGVSEKLHRKFYEKNMGSIKKKTAFWDYTANIYDVFVYLINAKTHKILRKKVGSHILFSDIVLECACGTGMLTEVIAPKCKKLIATDLSKNMVRNARAKCNHYSNVKFMIADILHLEFEDSTFDKVVAANVIHLLQEPLKALKELERVCRPGGKVIIPTYLSKQSSKRENEFAKTAGFFGVSFKQKFSFSSYQQFFIDAGYPDVLHIRIDGFVPCSIAVIEKES